jgi:(3,5-dihydroxyphenyl)acetyl-CoA 1,2-dioxygenase
MIVVSDEDETVSLRAAGLGGDDIASWAAAQIERTADFETDRARYSRFFDRCDDLLQRLPPKPRRNDAEAAAAAVLLASAREHRERFLAAHAEALYDRLTCNRSLFLRVDALVMEAASAVPGLTPTREQLTVEMSKLQRDKEGIEIDQGILLAHVLASERAGTHLCHAMLLPRPQAFELLPRLATDGRVDLGTTTTVERRGRAAHVTMANGRFLNAEDETTLALTELAVDLAILDPATDIAVMRGGELQHPKYRGRRSFGAGINLTNLYRGRIPYLWFMERDLGYVHKILRGVARPESVPDDVHGRGIEKPWIAVVDGFAIGGHCQLLLAMDYVLAASDAFMTLPARKEGIIPGVANLRLPRFTGDRIARQAIQYERKLPCDSPEGRLICDEIARPDELDAALADVIEGLSNAGAVSAIGNRRALRIGEEPLELFRRYCSAYARDQAYCAFSPALIANLERNWDAHNRRP